MPGPIASVEARKKIVCGAIGVGCDGRASFTTSADHNDRQHDPGERIADGRAGR